MSDEPGGPSDGISGVGEPEIDALIDLLEARPPTTEVAIDTKKWIKRTNGGNYLIPPEIDIFCDNEKCGGIRTFRSEEQSFLARSPVLFQQLYICSNCNLKKKSFFLAVTHRTSNAVITATCAKLGELPPFGPPTSPKLISLIGPDRELFLKGRRCESQGLGIGAFAYYRRVVENQKNRIIDEIIRVAKKIGVQSEMLTVLCEAKTEVQFSRAITSVKDAIPQSLLINGQNPLVLLHRALSDGLHTRTDEHCLELATDIRIVLGELAERLSQALKEDKEINTAISRLTKLNST